MWRQEPKAGKIYSAVLCHSVHCLVRAPDSPNLPLACIASFRKGTLYFYLIIMKTTFFFALNIFVLYFMQGPCKLPLWSKLEMHNVQIVVELTKQQSVLSGEGSVIACCIPKGAATSLL